MGNNVAKSAIIVMIATLIGKILGFGRELVLASVYGTSVYSDAYLVATNIPYVIFATIGAVVVTTFIPIYFEIKNKDGEERALEFTNNFLNIVNIICLILMCFGLVFTENIVKIFAIGFTGKALKLSIDFTQILILGITLYSVSYFLTAYLQIKNNFAIPAFAIIPKNVIIIIAIILSIKYGTYVMVIGTLLAMICEFLYLYLFAYKNGYRYKLYINIKDKYIKKSIYLSGPILIGVSVNQINIMVDKTLASTLAEGSISALNYANKLNGFVIALFITSVASVIYPMLSELSNEDNKENFINSIVKSINSVILLVIPISVGAMVLATPIVKMLFERGQFDMRATSMTSIALVMYSIGMVAVGLRDILGKVFYSLQDTKTPMINGAIAMVMNIILNLILIRYLQIVGLALATSISSILCILLLFRSLKMKIGYFGQDKIIKTTIKSVLSSIIMGIITYFGYNFMYRAIGGTFTGNLLSLFTSISVGAIIYLIFILIFKVEEINFIIDIIKKFSKEKYKKINLKQL